jgi:hypothetical protein
MEKWMETTEEKRDYAWWWRYVVIESLIVLVVYRSLWGGVAYCLMGIVFLYYGMTKTPLYFNEFNPWKKPVSVWLARVLYIPAGVLLLF